MRPLRNPYNPHIRDIRVSALSLGRLPAVPAVGQLHDGISVAKGLRTGSATQRPRSVDVRSPQPEPPRAARLGCPTSQTGGMATGGTSDVAARAAGADDGDISDAADEPPTPPPPSMPAGEGEAPAAPRQKPYADAKGVFAKLIKLLPLATSSSVATFERRARRFTRCLLYTSPSPRD